MDIYTSIGVAKEEIWRRWHDKELRSRVNEYLGGNLPDAFKHEPRAVLSRHIITPDIEFNRFLELSNKVALEAEVIEYIDDKFCSINSDKLGLAKMAFYHGRSRNGDAIISYRTVVDCASYDGKRFSEMKTLWDEDFVTFHHRLLALKTQTISYADYSSWFHFHGNCAAEYYTHLLALFICNGILFENYLTVAQEGEFTKNVVLPAIEELESLFGLKPLIIPVLPPDEVDDKSWWCYPANVESELYMGM
jgi:hypothetical protein